MFELSTLSTFLIVVLGLFLVPGPAVILTTTRAVQDGSKIGIATGLGIATGDFIHVVFAAVGFSAILMTSAFAFTVVKVAGALYLLYMGIQAILAKGSEVDSVKAPKVSTTSAYRQGILVEVLNPKTALFFIALFPQFINLEAGSRVAQFLVLGMIFVVLSILYTTTLTIGIRPISNLMKRATGIGKWGNKIVGFIYIGLGLKIVFQSR